MTEVVYLLRLCLYSLTFLLMGLLVGILMVLPDGRAICGLPDDALDRAFQAEMTFAQVCPGQMDLAKRWDARLEPEPEPTETKVKAGDVIGGMNAAFARFHDKLLRAAWPWLVLVGMRSMALVALLMAALPLLVAVWLLGRRRSWVLFRRGEPASDARRVTWAWMAGMVVFILGLLLAAPLAVPMTPWLLPTVLLAVALLHPVRAATAARM